MIEAILILTGALLLVVHELAERKQKRESRIAKEANNNLYIARKLK